MLGFHSLSAQALSALKRRAVAQEAARIDSLGGKKDKRIKGPKYYSPDDRRNSSRLLSDVRQVGVERILAERNAAIEDTPKEPVFSGDEQQAGAMPVSLAGGLLVPPAVLPAATVPEVQLFNIEDERRRRLMLLSL